MGKSQGKNSGTTKNSGMIRYHDAQGNSTPWMNLPYSEKQLKRLTIPQLLLLVTRQKGLKSLLIKFLIDKK